MNGGGGEAGREEKSSASCKSTIHGLLTGYTISHSFLIS